LSKQTLEFRYKRERTFTEIKLPTPAFGFQPGRYFNMYSPVAIAVLLCSLSCASAQLLTIHNACNIPAVWHVTPGASSNPIPIPPQSAYSEPISGTGVADKICTEEGGSPQRATEVDFQYTVSDDTTW